MLASSPAQNDLTNCVHGPSTRLLRQGSVFVCELAQGSAAARVVGYL
jgi:hypothetical protein